MSEPSNPQTTVRDFITDRVTQSDKTQREIANECGFDNPNIISMLKTGATKVPLNRIGTLAKALDADPAHLLRLVMTEYMPDTWVGIENIMHGSVLTANELDLVRRFRSATGDKDPQPVAFNLSPGSVFTLVTA